MNVPEVFNKYKTEIMQFSYTFVKFKNSNVDMGVYTIGTAYDLYKSINYTLSDFVYSAYIVNDIGLPSDRIDFDLTNHRFILECDITPETNAEKGLSVIALNPPEWEGSDNVWGIVYLYAESSLINLVAVRYEGCYPVFMLSGYDSRDITLDIEDSVEKNVKTEYYDPVLEAEPYSFYSLAYLSYEMPFNKNRYYVSNEIKIRYYVSVNGAIKLYYIPTYLVEDKEFNYYNEGLTFTLPSSLPLMSDSYASYYYQNKAQMKNQFAVNDYNRGVDLAQHFFLSGPNAVGQSAFKRGGYGAIAETINQFAQMGDEVIDWGQSNKVIEMNQKAKLADMGAKPDNVKQVGSDVLADLLTTENRPYVNHYKIDEASYNSISKFLERFGYEVGLYDSIHANDRVGWNFVKLTSFDWHGAEIMVEQEDNIKKIFNQGVTMLHDKSYLTSGHNYETILDE